MCIICTGNYNRDTITWLVLECQMITSIPVLPALTKLTCRRCPNLTYIPSLPKLEILRINECTKIEAIPKRLDRLIVLDLSDCCKIKSIPKTLGRLIVLGCIDCSKIKVIPSFAKLEKLVCMFSSITKIENSNQLKYLNCGYSPKLTSIEGCNNLETLFCNSCPLLTIHKNFVHLKKLVSDKFQDEKDYIKSCKEYFYSQWMRLNTNE
jgi:Leucine-rich repeat (LRR) protein